MAIDGRRLLRAGATAAVALLLLGGGIGVLAAAAQRVQDARTLTVPEPRPGDRATYSIERAAGPGPGPSGPTPSNVTFEWLAERWGVDADGDQRLVHPLRATFTVGSGQVVVESAYDAATGEPVSETHLWSGIDWNWDGPIVDPKYTPFYEMGQRNTRYDAYMGQLGPCAMSVPFAGRPYGGGEETLWGDCDGPGGRDRLTLQGQGWVDTPAGRAYRLVAKEDGRLHVDYDESSPFPASLDAALGEVFAGNATSTQPFALHRVSAVRGAGTYTPLDRPATRPGSAVRLSPRTPWMLDDSGVAKAFTLGQAYQAVLAEAPVQGSDTLPRWLASHPDGYLAHAHTLEQRGQDGQTTTQWWLLWVDGEARFGRRVDYGPYGVEPVLLPGAAGEAATVQPWSTDGYPYDGFPAARLPKDLVPVELPKVADLLGRFAGLTGVAGNSYGFDILCATPACLQAWVGVTAGRSEADAHTPVAGDLVTLVKPVVQNSDHIETDAGGQMRSRWTDVKSHEAVFPVVASGTAAEGTAPPAGHAALWAVPASGAVAGIGVLGALAGALAYFWPGVRGAFGASLFSRVDGGALLELGSRQRIMAAVQAEPGIHFMAISRATGLGRGALEHHLRKLVAADLLTVRKARGYTCYFAKGAVDRRVAQAAPLLRSDGSRAVFDAVRAQPGASGRELARRLGRSPSTVNYHLQRLQGAGLVLDAGPGGIQLSPLGEQAAQPAA